MNDKTLRDPESVKKLVQWLGEGYQALAELVDTLHGSIDELEQNNRSLTRQITDLTDQRDTLEEQERIQARKILALEEQNQSQAQRIQELKQTLRQISDRRDELDRRAADLTKQLEEATAETQRLHGQLSEQQATVDVLTARVEQLINENDIEKRGFNPIWQDMLNFFKRNP